MIKQNNTSNRYQRKKNLPFYIALITASAIAAPSFAQEAAKAGAASKITEEVLVTGMRASVQSAQQLKRDSAVVQDSIVAEDIGKLPDRSIAEALQRISGITVSRFDNPSDPEHFAGEGAGVSIRGLTQVRSELNGRDIFSAGDGRSLSFEDVPAELMAGVDVYKSPTADMVEGGLGGIVNLRTRMPLDKEGQLVSSTLKFNYGDIIKEVNPEGSVLYSNNWDTKIGRLGFLVDISKSTTSSRADNLYTRAYLPRTNDAPYNLAIPGDKYSDATYYTPRGADWRRNDYESTRDGQYLALQWQPSDSIDIYATAFQSRAKREWYENGFFLDAGVGDALPVPAPITGLPDGDTDDWVFDANNALVSGTMTASGGIPFGTSSRLSNNDSKTADISTGFKWNKNGWTVSADYQRVISSAEADDYTLGTVIFPKYMSVADLDSADGPIIIDVENHLSKLSNYSFGQMMSQPKDNHADSNAVRLDVQYDFEDSIVTSVKSGVRFSEREANNRSTTDWSARVQPWNTGGWSPVPTISAGNPLMQEFAFDDFQRGNAEVPSSGWMFTREAVADFRATTDAMVAQTQANSWASGSAPIWDDLDLNNPKNVSNQKETNKAIYVMANFEFSDSFGGNAGVRYVTTSLTSDGYFRYDNKSFVLNQYTPEEETVRPLLKDAKYVSYDNDYDFVLPSLNLRFNPTDELVFRFSASQQIWKPEFWRTSASQKLGGDHTEFATEDDKKDPDSVYSVDADGNPLYKKKFENEGNPYLEPMVATQFDLTAEWYFNDNGGMLYTGLFSKKVDDLFRVQSFTEDYEEFDNLEHKQVVNIGTADVNGIEVGGTYYFDTLPGPLKGFGVSANYTYIDSSSDVPEDSGAEPVDTDGSLIVDIPLEGLAENTYNLTLMYEYAGFYSRLAYSWHSEVFQDVGPNGWNGDNYKTKWKLPVYADDYGQLDLSMGYNVSENFSINFEASNLLGEDTTGFIRQNAAGDHTAYVYTNDARYAISFRATY